MIRQPRGLRDGDRIRRLPVAGVNDKAPQPFIARYPAGLDESPVFEDRGKAPQKPCDRFVVGCAALQDGGALRFGVAGQPQAFGCRGRQAAQYVRVAGAVLQPALDGLVPPALPLDPLFHHLDGPGLSPQAGDEPFLFRQFGFQGDLAPQLNDVARGQRDRGETEGCHAGDDGAALPTERPEFPCRYKVDANGHVDGILLVQPPACCRTGRRWRPTRKGLA